VVKKPINQGLIRLPGTGVDHKAGGFIHNEESVILIDNSEGYFLRLKMCWRGWRWRKSVLLPSLNQLFRSCDSHLSSRSYNVPRFDPTPQCASAEGGQLRKCLIEPFAC
jgi:hypothetical protein